MDLLLEAIRTNHTDAILQAILSGNVAINDNQEYTLYYGTPLHHAVSQRGARLNLLWLLGANVDATDYYHDTPLQQNDRRSVEALLHLGANIYIPNCFDETPLHMAVRNNNYNLMHTLMIPHTKGHRLWVKWRPILRVLACLSTICTARASRTFGNRLPAQDTFGAKRNLNTCNLHKYLFNTLQLNRPSYIYTYILTPLLLVHIHTYTQTVSTLQNG